MQSSASGPGAMTATRDGRPGELSLPRLLAELIADLVFLRYRDASRRQFVRQYPDFGREQLKDPLRPDDVAGHLARPGHGSRPRPGERAQHGELGLADLRRAAAARAAQRERGEQSRAARGGEHGRVEIAEPGPGELNAVPAAVAAGTG